MPASVLQSWTMRGKRSPPIWNSVHLATDGFFVSPFIDYSGKDSLFRKYRIAMIDSRPFPVHMAIAAQWKVWYLNADMALNVAHRTEEAKFMQFFDDSFGRRHANALTEIGQARRPVIIS